MSYYLKGSSLRHRLQIEQGPESCDHANEKDARRQYQQFATLTEPKDGTDLAIISVVEHQLDHTALF